MTSIDLILAGIAALGLSGAPGYLFGPASKAGQRAVTVVALLGSALGLSGIALSLALSGFAALSVAWALPLGSFSVELDALSLPFLALVFAIPALGSVYALGYYKNAEHVEGGRFLGLAYGLLAGSMALVTIARDALLFLVAWEIMAISAYFAATAERDSREARRAGWIYLIATHIGTLCLIAMFALWRRATGSFDLVAAGAVDAKAALAIFALAIVGFGFKAGLMPLHFWLPGAHANAPSHVSAVMSGVMLKMGVYGIARMSGLLPPGEAWQGGILIAVGAVTGIAGIAYAIGQSDMKRLLAYSSVENVGIIAMGLGLATLGRSLGRGDLVALGLGGALLHSVNHGLFKPLLFLGAGSLIHATGTRDLDGLGGIAKKAPFLAALVLVGSIAISALPPLNGFAGELLLYLGFFRSLGPGGAAATTAAPLAAAAAAALAMIGALALACFVKLYGSVFLGSPRSAAAERAHESPAIMAAPMAVLATLCVVIGLFPALVAPMLESATRAWSAAPGAAAAPGAVAAPSLAELAPLGVLAPLGAALAALAAVVYLALRLGRGSRAAAGPTWDCGYARPDARMQYTASSFGASIVDIFAFFLMPKDGKARPRGPFPAAARFRRSVPDAVLGRLAVPASILVRRFSPRIRILQQGSTNAYLFYVLVVTIILLVLAGVRP